MCLLWFILGLFVGGALGALAYRALQPIDHRKICASQPSDCHPTIWGNRGGSVTAPCGAALAELPHQLIQVEEAAVPSMREISGKSEATGRVRQPFPKGGK
jgi:hypothetical protein